MALLKSGAFAVMITSIVGGLAAAKVIDSPAQIALLALSAYSLMRVGALHDIAIEDGQAPD
jgi:hypothetical protein